MYADKEVGKRKAKERYLKNKEAYLAVNKVWRLANPERKRAHEQNHKYKNPGYYLIKSAKSTAKKNGYAFDLEAKDIKIPEFCPVFGFRLTSVCGPRADFMPSLDRIDPNKGYTKDNVWVISWKANKLKLNNTLETLRLLVAALEARGQQW